MFPARSFTATGGTLTLASSKTFSLAAGTVVKADHGSVLTVQGTLRSVGSAGAPVVFTSVDDPTAGGASGDGEPTIGDWSGIAAASGAVLDLSHTRLGWAAAAVQFSGDSERLADTTIDHSDTAVAVTSGAVSLRGSVKDSRRGVAAYDWNTNCTVDAAYVDWGPAGPLSGGSPALVCGAVTVTPWPPVSDSGSLNLWAVGNCSPTASPEAELAAAKARYEHTIDLAEIDCSGGMHDACDAMRRHQQCYEAAEELAWSHVTVAGIPADLPDTSSVTDVVSAWMKTAESETVKTLGEVIEFADKIIDVMDLCIDLTKAYKSCS